MTRSDGPQPQSPDQGELVHENADYTLTGAGDPLDAGYVPADRPYARSADGLTPAEMREGESLDSRLARELPEDAGPVDTDRAGRLAAAADAPDAALDVGVDGGSASAEEAAVHRTGGESDALEPVVDDGPLDDPEVAATLDEGPRAEQAERDADRDADGDPIAGRDDEHRHGAERIDTAPEAGGAAAPASGIADAGPDARLP